MILYSAWCETTRVYRNAGRGVMLFVHGDDCVSAGPTCHLNWLRGELEGKYTLNSQVLDDDSTDGSEIKKRSSIV